MNPTVKGYLAAAASAASYGMNPLGALSLYDGRLLQSLVGSGPITFRAER